MGRYWRLMCPYCKAEVASGSGYGDKIPEIWIPFMRCEVCGKLFALSSKEFLTIPPETRVQLSNDSKMSEYIESSLDRTNSEQYVSFLRSKGCNIYPITDKDRERFNKVFFDEYEKKSPTDGAIQLLHQAGIFIEEDKLDKQTGGIKQEILEENQANYKTNKKANAWGSIIGLIIGLISCIILGSVDPKGYLFLVGIAIGFAAYFLTFMWVSHINKNHENGTSSQAATSRKAEDKTTQAYDRVKESFEQDMRESGYQLEKPLQEKYSRMFRQSFANIVAMETVEINGKKCIIYTFNPFSSEFFNIGGFCYVIKVTGEKPRYFASEYSYDNTYVLCEWVFDGEKEVSHVNYGEVVSSLSDVSNHRNNIKKKLKEILA